MKIYNTQEEVNADLNEYGDLIINDDVTFNFSLKIDGNIVARNIEAWNIDAQNIKAWRIQTWNINAANIDAGNIDAANIEAWNVEALDINAGNIDAANIVARDIEAWSIEADKISYYAFCIVYKSIRCTSIEGRRENSKHLCLDGEIVIKKDREDDLKTNI